MGRKQVPGLFKRNDIWRIDKYICGRRIQESTGSRDMAEAERYLMMRAETIRQSMLYGVRPSRIFEEAADKYVEENQHKTSIQDDISRLKLLKPLIGDMPLEGINMPSLQVYIAERKKSGVKMRTINHGLKVVRRILNLAATEWFDEQGKTWLAQAPRIKMLPEPDMRKPYPLTWAEQELFFAKLPEHLRNMALFAVNTGCRDQEVCQLRWEWEVPIPELNTSVFLIPWQHVKNREDRMVVLNDIAKEVIDKQRSIHPEFVFTFKGKQIYQMLNTGWKKARELTKIEARVHDLKHTFGIRLSAAGVSFENRQILLGHRLHRITEHYSPADVKNLLESANKVCSELLSSPTIIRRRGNTPAKVPMGQNVIALKVA